MDSGKLSDARVDVVILAAGESKRLGSPKQLVKLESGKTLLQQTVDAALGSGAGAVHVILGYRAEEIAGSVPSDDRVRFIENSAWDEGMGSSVRHAHTILASRNLTGVIISVCDQPGISGAVFDRLIGAHATDRGEIVASRYASGARGVPVLIPSSEFEILVDCRGDRGLRDILQSGVTVREIDFAEGDFDVDTEDDLTRSSYRAELSKSKS